jgi:hypothetical protein|nr:MAG TPA: hypothetical protein [Caudoviricetes sp.]
MTINELQDINWETVTVDDLTKAHELKGISFEVDNGRISRIFIDEEELD